jgi:mono/diheme cytochrome c family protein
MRTIGGHGLSMNWKRGFLITSTVLLGALLLFESGATALQRRKIRRAAARPKAEDLFRSNCARCHGADGRGDTPLGKLYKAPDFTDREWWRENAGMTRTRSLVSIVTRGKAGMPAFGRKLNRSEISALVKYMRRFKNQSAPAPAQE